MDKQAKPPPDDYKPFIPSPRRALQILADEHDQTRPRSWPNPPNQGPDPFVVVTPETPPVLACIATALDGLPANLRPGPLVEMLTDLHTAAQREKATQADRATAAARLRKFAPYHPDVAAAFLAAAVSLEN